MASDFDKNIYAKFEVAVHALRNIEKFYGKVCPEYEICDHDYCASSSGAWFEANSALNAIRQLDEEPVRYRA